MKHCKTHKVLDLDIALPFKKKKKKKKRTCVGLLHRPWSSVMGIPHREEWEEVKAQAELGDMKM